MVGAEQDRVALEELVGAAGRVDQRPDRLVAARERGVRVASGPWACEA